MQTSTTPAPKWIWSTDKLYLARRIAYKVNTRIRDLGLQKHPIWQYCLPSSLARTSWRWAALAPLKRNTCSPVGHSSHTTWSSNLVLIIYITCLVSVRLWIWDSQTSIRTPLLWELYTLNLMNLEKILSKLPLKESQGSWCRPFLWSLSYFS